jgi:hypothetical protein
LLDEEIKEREKIRHFLITLLPQRKKESRKGRKNRKKKGRKKGRKKERRQI